MRFVVHCVVLPVNITVSPLSNQAPVVLEFSYNGKLYVNEPFTFVGAGATSAIIGL